MADRKIQYIPLDDIVTAERNAKTHNVPGIQKSMGRWGVVEIMVRDDRTGRLVAGHGRHESLLASRETNPDDAPEGAKIKDGVWLVPVVVGWSSEDDKEADAAAVALNYQNELGGWDETMREEILRDIEDLTGTGFEVPDMDLSDMSDDERAMYGLDGDDIDETETPDLSEEKLAPYEFGFVLIRFELEAAGAIARALEGLDEEPGVTVRQTMK